MISQNENKHYTTPTQVASYNKYTSTIKHISTMNSNPDTNGSKKGQKLVVIGGVAGGASFAARARRLDETAEIILLQVWFLNVLSK